MMDDRSSSGVWHGMGRDGKDKAIQGYESTNGRKTEGSFETGELSLSNTATKIDNG
jgi:hypothetical protein